MYVFSEPVVSISVHANSLSQIQNELESFGLNPNDWRAVQSSQFERFRLILAHRDDQDLRLAIHIKGGESEKAPVAIRDIEMMVM